MNQYPLLTFISLFSVVLPIGVGISKIAILHRGMKILFLYLVFAFTADIYLMWFVKGYQLNVELIHAYYLIENVFIMSIIITWQESHRIKRIFQALLLLYILFWIIAKVTFEPLSGLYTFTASTSQILMTIGAQITLLVIVGNRIQPIIKDYRFWVLLSFIIYYAGTLLIIASRGILIHYSVEILFLVNSIDWCLKIIFNILFAIGFLCPQTRA
jgi:hypothetical protein